MRTPLIIDVDKVTIAVLLMIGRHVDKPCPTREMLIECTRLPRRRAWQFVWDLHARRLIEIEMRGTGKGHQRRMRVQGGPWTLWTQRRAPSEGQTRLLEEMRM
jgi:hypothetical protein